MEGNRNGIILVKMASIVNLSIVPNKTSDENS